MQQDLRKTGTVGEGSYVPPTLQLEDGNRRRQWQWSYIVKQVLQWTLQGHSGRVTGKQILREEKNNRFQSSFLQRQIMTSVLWSLTAKRLFTTLTKVIVKNSFYGSQGMYIATTFQQHTCAVQTLQTANRLHGWSISWESTGDFNQQDAEMCSLAEWITDKDWHTLLLVARRLTCHRHLQLSTEISLVTDWILWEQH